MKRTILTAALLAGAALAAATKPSLVQLADKSGVTSADLAREARRIAPWHRQITDELWTEYILPDTVIDEAQDDWRPMFTKLFAPVVKGARTPTEAVKKINAVIWKKLDVEFSMERDFPNQSPFHSMRIHKASCTGQTILQVCAYRSVGVPARLVTCNWTTRTGNHSWVEYWDKGWHFFGTGDAKKPDDGWVGVLAAEADATDISKHIYASRATPTGTWLWRTWGAPNAPIPTVPAEDVTERYRAFKQKTTGKRPVIDAGRPRSVKTGEVIYASPEPSKHGYFVPKGRSKLLLR